MDILHVEDDLALGAIISLTFSSLGLDVRAVTAATVREGENILSEAARTGKRFELIISDMNLPDGSGLDFVRCVRSSPIWKTTPMLILSGDVDPRKVGRAYALGANAYVSKWPPGRSLDQVIRTLYSHWMSDVVPPRPPESQRIAAVITRYINIRVRYAQVYQRVAGKFSESPPEAAFWLSRALCESNLTNMLALLRNQLADEDLDPEDLSEAEDLEAAMEAAVTAFEYDLNLMTRDGVYLRVLELFSTRRIRSTAEILGRLFPIVPMGVTTIFEFLYVGLQDIISWIEMHTTVRDIRERAAQLRNLAVEVRDRHINSPPPAGSR
jgi:CheY-like chemotaxis protein